jgi:exodeoxyribonuclease V gamma subunit
MAFHVHRAARTDLLADSLGALLRTPLADPFAEELVLVPARGVERWLSQRLSHVLGRRAEDASSGTDGVCAGVSFRSPRSLIAELTGTTRADPWAPDALVWPLLEAIDTNLDEQWCHTLATHLGHFNTGDEAELRMGRRYAVARRIAGLFAAYAAQRPQLLIDWSAGDASDGIAGRLDDDLTWQPPLWRALTARVPAEPPAVRHRKTIERLQESTLDLPPRLSLFGHTRLPITEIELLTALSARHDLHLWLPHPSDTLWRALADAPDLPGALPRRDDTSRRVVGHPLLATLGRDLRELQRCLPKDAALDEDLGAGPTPDTLLGWLQSDIRENTVRAGQRVLAADDRSVQVHSCHGPARQIEVLREVLLALLDDDPSLEPRDILIMCPDVETYAPLIVAGFGLGDMVPGGHPAHRLRIRLADRALTQTNPLLGTADALLGLAGGRATATDVLNLAQSAPVRARFGFTDDDLDVISAWVRESGVRWGFDKEHRTPYHLGDFVQNTWRFGIDRVLAGVAMSEDSRGWIGVTLPLDDVGSNRVELAGRLAEYIDRLVSVIDGLSGTRPLSEWLDALRDGIQMLTRTAVGDEWQTGHLHREFGDVLEDAGTRGQTALRLADVRALLGGHLAGRPTRVNFRTGTLTVCTMVPMRSVPHRVVCLVGLDDGVFPRLRLVDGDDVLSRTPVTGERDIRSEDRQLLLDAIGAATEKLVVTYTGANEHTGQPRPPAVPLVELLDALDLTTTAPVRTRIVVRQPLQPFDRKNVTPGALGVAGQPFSFDPTALIAARAATGPRPEQVPFFGAPLPELPRDDVELSELLGFFRDPVRGFFRALDYTLPWDVDGIQDAMPVEIDALEEWGVGDRLLGDMLRGMHPDDAAHTEWRRGTLPPGRLGARKAKEIRDQATGLARVALQLRHPAATGHDVDIDLGAGRRLTGTVAPVFGDRIVAVTYSKLAGKHLLDSWIRLLALAAHDPGRPWSALCIGRAKRGASEAIRRLEPDPQVPSVEILADLVRLYDTGRRAPLPLPMKASFAWAEARRDNEDPERAAEWRWKSNKFPGEDQDEGYVRVWGHNASLRVLLDPPGPGEAVPGEATRLGAYAARLWSPLLRAERGAP